MKPKTKHLISGLILMAIWFMMGVLGTTLFEYLIIIAERPMSLLDLRCIIMFSTMIPATMFAYIVSEIKERGKITWKKSKKKNKQSK